MLDEQERLFARGLKAGQPEAWQTLYDAYSQRVWWFAARLMGSDSVDVADVVQETFMAAADSARNYDPQRGSLWGWISGILRNQVALYFRKQARQEQIRRAAEALRKANGQFIRWMNGGNEAPEDLLEKADLVAVVRAVLVTLPKEYESLLTAKYLDEVSVDQMAHSENRTETAIRSRLARARRAFRDAFEKLALGSGYREREEGV